MTEVAMGSQCPGGNYDPPLAPPDELLSKVGDAGFTRRFRLAIFVLEFDALNDLGDLVRAI